MARWLGVILAAVVALQLCEGRPAGLFDRLILAGRRRGTSMVPPPPPEAYASNDNVKTAYFDQPLDHFDGSVKDTWKQRYQVNEAVYKAGGPVFVMIGGEGPIDAGWMTYGQMYQNAIAHNALIFQPEHRFYGASHPTSDASTDNLRYLTSVQALADLDAFIKGMKDQYNIPDAKVVVFGGSYPGNLAVWYRELYPESSVGSVASSAPVLAEEDFVEYIETVGNAQKYYNPDCYDAVNDAFQAIESLVADKNDAQLNKLFGICGGGKLNYSDPYAVETFYSSLINPWMGATQYNAFGNTSEVWEFCNVMANTQLGDPIDRLSRLSKTIVGSCASQNYQVLVTELKQTAWTSPFVSGGDRQWIWQTCTEFAYYQTTDSKNQPFGLRTVDIDYYEDIYCKQPFGISHDDIVNSVTASNKRYGGRSPNATNVFLFNGSIDPWHTLSIYQNDLNPTSPSRYIQGTSHCYDMYEARPDDPPDLTKARQEMADTVSAWLAA